MPDTPDRKKLSIKTATRPASERKGPAGQSDERSRSGPRARRVAIASLESDKQRRMDSTRPPEPGAEPSRPARSAPARTYERPASARSGSERPAPERLAAGRSSDRSPSDRSSPDRAPSGRPYSDRSGSDRGDRPARANPRDNEPFRASSGFRPRGSPPRNAPPKPKAAPERVPMTIPGNSPSEVFNVFAPCPQGLEAALVDELRALGFADARTGRAGAHLTADWSSVMRLNLHSRLATRILVQVNHATVYTEDELLELARATPWERWFGAEQTLRVDTSAVRSPMQSLQFCNLRAKDGICDRLRDLEGERPSIDTVRPDARVHVFLSENTATLYLDTSGESLFKRGWRLDKGEAPLRENLAAGMLALSGWQTDAPLLDPFCGSGTILIEAALKALKVPPGISRPFAFERLRGHHERQWRDLKDDARAHILKALPMQLAGADIDEQAIAAARENAQRAGLTDDAVYFEVADARDTCALDDKAGWIITNPPYGERIDLEPDQEALLWSEWATTLKREFNGWQLHIITNDLDLPKKLRLNPSRRTPLYNGALECRLFGFELVTGGFRK